MLSPLLLLIAVLLACVTIVTTTTNVRIIGAVMTVVPVIAVVWAALQREGGRGARPAERAPTRRESCRAAGPNSCFW